VYRLKILQVISSFPPAYAYGGALRVAYGVSKELVTRGHEVTVYTTDVYDGHSRLRYAENPAYTDGIRVFRFKNVSNKLAHKNLPLAPAMFMALKREIENFDIVHIHEYISFQALFAHHFSQKYEIPYIFQPHGSLPSVTESPALKRIHKIYEETWGYKMLRDASKIIALNQIEAEQCQSADISEGKIRTIPNGIDPAEFENLPLLGKFREKNGLNNNQKIILYLGRIHRTKGLDLLVKAYARLSDSLNEANLIIVGPDDGYALALKALIKELQIQQKVLFTGALYGEERLEALIDADVFVTPSFYGFPVTFVEACACGTPIVTTERGDRLDWIHNQVGYVTEYNEDQLETGVAKILGNAALAKKFQRKGKRLTKERFNWSVIAKQVEGLYLECLPGSASG